MLQHRLISGIESVLDPLDSWLTSLRRSSGELAESGCQFIHEEGEEQPMPEQYADVFYAAGRSLRDLDAGPAWRSAELLHTRPADPARGRAWTPHNDFVRFAATSVRAQIRDRTLSNIEMSSTASLLARLRPSNTNATNWIAMRAYAAACGERPAITRASESESLLREVLRRQEEGGCFADIPGVCRSIQYHCYTSYVGELIARVSDSEALITALDKGASYTLSQTPRDGYVNFRGRGAGQIFGFATAAASLVFRGVRANDECSLLAADRILSWIRLSQRADGAVPLVVGVAPHQVPTWWLDYNAQGVYAAFTYGVLASCWRALQLARGSTWSPTPAEPVRRDWEGQPEARISSGESECFVTAGGRKYGSELPAAPVYASLHGHAPLFLGGSPPSLGRYGARFASTSDRLLSSVPYSRSLAIASSNVASTVVGRVRSGGDASAELTYGASEYESSVQLEIGERSLRSRLRIIRKPHHSSSVDCVSVAVPCDSETFQQRGPLQFAFQWQGTQYYLDFQISGDVSEVCRAPGSVQLLAGVGVAIETVFSLDWSAVNVDWTLSCRCTH